MNEEVQTASQALNVFGHTIVGASITPREGETRSLAVIVAITVAREVVQKGVFDVLTKTGDDDHAPEVRCTIKASKMCVTIQRVDFGVAPRAMIARSGFPDILIAGCVVVTVCLPGTPNPISGFVIKPDSVESLAA